MLDYSLRLKSGGGPAIEPVSLPEFKVAARIDHSLEDGFLKTVIAGARQLCELYTGRAFIHQSWEMSFDSWPAEGVVAMPRPPLVSVTSIKTLDTALNPTAVDSSLYFLDTRDMPGKVISHLGAVIIPTLEKRGIVIEYVAGYGASVNDVPEAIRLGIEQAAIHIYQTRFAELSEEAKRMLEVWRVIDL